MPKSEQEKIRKHLLDLEKANNTIAEINKAREERKARKEGQFRPISPLTRSTSVLKDLDTRDDIEIPIEQEEIWKTSYSKGGRRGTRVTKQKPIKRKTKISQKQQVTMGNKGNKGLAVD